jgi:hypothetical protein
MSRKILLILSLVISIFALSSCGQEHRPVDWVDVTCEGGAVFIGDTIVVEVLISPMDATDQGYSISILDPSIANFTGNALEVEGISVGTTWVNVYTDDGNYFNECSITVDEQS